MASKDVLSLSLDDIIKLRGKQKRENSRGRGKRSRGGQERGAGQSVRGQGRGRGRGQGQVRGRGPRLVTSKFRGGIMRGTRGRGALATRSSRGLTRGLVRGVTRAGNRRGSSILNGRGRGAQLGRGARGGGGGPGRGGGLRGIRGGRGGLRGRATTTVLRRRGGGGGGIQRGAVSQQVNRQNRQENITARDTSFRQRLARRKIQQARKTLVQSQQNNRTKTRLNMVNARRGIQDGMRGGGGGGRGGGSVVSLSTHHGLTVSIKNNIATKPSLNPGSAPRGRPRLNRSRSWQSSAASNYSSSSSAMFTVVNDQALPPPTQTSPLQRLPNRRMLNRNYALGRDSREAEMAMAPMGYIHNNYSHPSPPEPHRQILDPKVQKEIAMLQGKQQVSMYSAPGPGVKGFRHIPSNTTRSLNERFTEERMITT